MKRLKPIHYQTVLDDLILRFLSFLYVARLSFTSVVNYLFEFNIIIMFCYSWLIGPMGSSAPWTHVAHVAHGAMSPTGPIGL